MLLPALNKARQKARSAACISNLKQTATMVAMYADDYNGSILVKIEGAATEWTHQLIATGFLPAENLAQVRCPDVAKDPQDSTTDPYGSPQWAFGCNYTAVVRINGVDQYDKSVSGYSRNGNYHVLTPSRFKNPSDYLFFSDNRQRDNLNRMRSILWGMGGSWATAGMFYRAHGDAVPASWGDGHVSSPNAAELKEKFNSGATFTGN